MGGRFDSFDRVRAGDIVDLDALQAGDVILSRPATWESFWIAKFGRSRFSHAALVVSEGVQGSAGQQRPGGLNRLIIEATTEEYKDEIVGGVGFARFRQKRIRKRNSPDLPTGHVFPLGAYTYFEVFRHRAFGTPEFGVFLKASIASSCDRYVNHPYARLEDLAKVSVAPWLVNLLGKWFVRLPASRSGGFFCSQLVAIIFRDGGFDLSGEEPSLMRPEDLANSPHLERITQSIRRQMLANEELIGLHKMIAELAPSALSGIAEPEALAAILPDDDIDSDFRGRLTQWRLRDILEENKRHQDEVITSLKALQRALGAIDPAAADAVGREVQEIENLPDPSQYLGQKE